MGRSFAPLRMTRLDLAVDEELSRSFEPCLENIAKSQTLLMSAISWLILP